MKENSTLLFIIDDYSNYNYLVNIRELFEIFSTEEISDAFEKFEYSPPDRVIKNILSKVY